MVSSSPYPSIEIPKVDIWDFLFERDDREWPDDQGEQNHVREVSHTKSVLRSNICVARARPAAHISNNPTRGDMFWEKPCFSMELAEWRRA